MNILLNGEKREFTKVNSVSDLLQILAVEPESVVVEINTTIIDSSQFAHQIIADGDHIEIIRFVGGG